VDSTDRPGLMDSARRVAARLGDSVPVMRVQVRWTQLRCSIQAGRLEWYRIEFERAEKELPPRARRLLVTGRSSLERRYESQFTWRQR
jgi:hypothetical protein